MKELVEYFIEQTNGKFDEIKSDIKDLNDKLQDLNKFKTSIVTTSKIGAFLISSVVSLIGFIVTIWATRH